jgi:hypothetical protein
MVSGENTVFRLALLPENACRAKAFPLRKGRLFGIKTKFEAQSVSLLSFSAHRYQKRFSKRPPDGVAVLREEARKHFPGGVTPAAGGLSRAREAIETAAIRGRERLRRDAPAGAGRDAGAAPSDKIHL